MALSPQWLDELRASTTLSTLIGRTVRVQKAGREYKACCPFHDEKTPSFTINDQKGFYHCFGCGAHGDAIRWMTDQRGLPFMDAVKELAAEAGMEVPAPDPRAAKIAVRKASLHDVTAAAQDYFVAQLNGLEGAEARHYLERRGIDESTARSFGFGFAPDSRGRIKSALSNFDTAQLVETGLLISVDGKDPYDRFRGRLMLPIRDVRGRVIGFGGRILGQGEPKYLNSPDTPLFDKGRTLYNLDRAMPASRQSGRMLVVEGYMDAVALTQGGFEDVVAPLGTALTETQIEMLWRSVERPLLCFDGDSAGQRAALRAATRALPLLRPGHSLDFLNLPAGRDPDDVIRGDGPAEFAKLIEAKQPLVELLWSHERRAKPLETPEERADLRRRLFDHVRTVGDGEVRNHYAQAFEEKLAQLFAVRRPVRQQRSNGGRNKGFGRPTFTPPAMTETRSLSMGGIGSKLEAAVITGLIRYPECIAPHFEQLSAFEPEEAWLGELLEWLLEHSSFKETLDESGLLAILKESSLYNKARRLMRADTLNFTFCRNIRPDEKLDVVETGGTDTAQNATVTNVDHRSRRDRARADLDEAIRVMIERPGLAAALNSATQRLQTAMDDNSWEEWQKLRLEIEQFDSKLIELTSQDEM